MQPTLMMLLGVVVLVGLLNGVVIEGDGVVPTKET